MKANDIIINRDNPEWGTFRIIEDDEQYWFVIRSNSGSRVLSKTEATRFWKLAE